MMRATMWEFELEQAGPRAEEDPLVCAIHCYRCVGFITDYEMHGFAVRLSQRWTVLCRLCTYADERTHQEMIDLGGEA